MISRRDFLLGRGKAPARPAARVLGTCFELHGVVCGNCRDACGVRAVRFLALGAGTAKPVIDPARCDGCGECMRACPASAIQMTARDE